MEGISNLTGGGTSGASGASSQSSQDLQAAFDTAIQQARETLEISTRGNAELNALRARPQ
ncbi:MAG: hypothetical protein AAGA88_01180 [Pseudomonadota bacterium]